MRNTFIMLNVLSILIGLVALLFAIPATIPLLGALNWLILPIAAFGFLLGLMSDKKSGQILRGGDGHLRAAPVPRRRYFLIFQ